MNALPVVSQKPNIRYYYRQLFSTVNIFMISNSFAISTMTANISLFLKRMKQISL